MSRQKAGLQKEHDLAQSVYETTGGSVIPLRAGWSGNSAVPAPDLLVPLKGSLRAIEIKTSNQKRIVVNRDDIEDVLNWAMNMNEIHTYPYLSIKFSYYEMQTMRLEQPWDVERSLELLDKSCPFDTNITRGGNISFGNPSEYDSDVIGANKSPGDGAALLRDLRNDNFANVEDADMDTVGVYEVLEKI
jgi:Holliday junction resolvase - archaeal type